MKLNPQERYAMKQAVIERDGLTTCFWCREPFLDLEQATLEHIKPLADGGAHDLRNCTLACMKCNLNNQPRRMIDLSEQREKRALEKRLKNGWKPPEDCDINISVRFPAIAQSRSNKPLDHASASYMLKQLHVKLRLGPPSGHQKSVFKSHFNRWLSLNQNRL